MIAAEIHMIGSEWEVATGLNTHRYDSYGDKIYNEDFVLRVLYQLAELRIADRKNTYGNNT